MRPDGFGPSGGDGGFGGGAGGSGGGAGGAVPAGGHALPVRTAGSPDGALVFGGRGERPGFELGSFDLDEFDEFDDFDEIDEFDDGNGDGEIARNTAAPAPATRASAAGSAAPTSSPAARGAFDRADGGAKAAAAAAAAAADASASPTAPVGTGLAGSTVTAARSLFGPQTVVEAVQVLAERPDAVIIAGGTAAMPDITEGRRHPRTVLTLHRCAELRGWSTGPGEVLLHAGLTLAEMSQRELREQVPALNQAARTIGAPHLRAAATLGGNLVVGPACADLPVVLAALGASVLVASADGVRTVPVAEFYDRDGVPHLLPGELVVGARVPVVEGMQGFMKIGVRGGISRAILSIMLAVDPARRTATCVVGAMAVAVLPAGIGRGGLPALLRADHADRWLADQVDWEAGAIADPTVYETFGRLVADSLVYGDGGGTLGGGGDPYRRKAVEICARRALLRALPPLGWLDQVRELQKRADFQRAKQRVERAEQARNQDQ